MDSDRKVKFYIQVYMAIIVDEEDKEYYSTAQEAISDANNMEAMQCDNIYEVIKVTTDCDGDLLEETIATINDNVGG